MQRRGVPLAPCIVPPPMHGVLARKLSSLQPACHQKGLARPQPTLYPQLTRPPQRAMTRLGSLFPGTKWLGGLQAYLPYLPSAANSPFPMTVFDMLLGRASEAGVWGPPVADTRKLTACGVVQRAL